MSNVDPCHKSLHLHFSKRLKSLLYFHASLIILLSIRDVERRDRLTVLKSNSHFQAGDKNYHQPFLPPVYMCVFEKAVRNQTFERIGRLREEGRAIILSLMMEICPLKIIANVRGQ